MIRYQEWFRPAISADRNDILTVFSHVPTQFVVTTSVSHFLDWEWYALPGMLIYLLHQHYCYYCYCDSCCRGICENGTHLETAGEPVCSRNVLSAAPTSMLTPQKSVQQPFQVSWLERQHDWYIIISQVSLLMSLNCYLTKTLPGHHEILLLLRQRWYLGAFPPIGIALCAGQ